MLKRLSAKLAAVVMVFAMTALGAIAQNRSISGTVVDQAGVPVVGAAVVVAGNSTNGAVTDLDGKFSLSVPSGAKLEVSCIGYASATVTVGEQSSYQIVLAEDTELLEETVVIGYGVQKKSDLTGSVASVKSEDLTNRSTTDAAAALQGKAAGIQILNQSGAPGKGAQIRVRGYSSNSGSIGPLLIVDGLKVDNIQYLDPSMIASMEVLKDAASAAIYGAEAGNGVVLITTKSGSKQGGHASISYDGKFTLNMLGKKAELFDGDSYVEHQKYIGNLNDDILSVNGYKPGMNYDWFDQVFENSWSVQHSLTVQGGNDKGHYFTALNYVNNDGIVKGDKDVYKRLSAQINADYNIFKWFNIGTNTSFEKYDTKSVSQYGYGSVLNSVMALDPLTPAYYSNIEDCTLGMQSRYADPETRDMILRDPKHNNDFYATSKYIEEATGNPLLQRDRTQAKNGGLNIRGSLYGNLTPIKGLVITSRFGYRISQSSSHSFSAPYWATGMAQDTKYHISSNVNTSYYYQWENFANYNKNIGKHAISAMVGISYTENNRDNSSISAEGTDILKATDVNSRYIDFLKSDANKTVGNAPDRSSSLSYFGRIGYSYDNRYSIQANFRADAFDSSKLSDQNRWGYFPSFSAGWTVSNEKFFKNNINSDIVSFLKIRGSWGRNGNVSVLNGYPYAATVTVNGEYYQMTPEAGKGLVSFGSAPSGLPNPKLNWEVSEQIDLGLDARMFRDRFTIGVDWYKKTTKDLLIQFAPVPEIGVSSTYKNAGDIQNRGLEFELSWKDQIGDFSYSVSANIATLKNKVTYLMNTVPRIESDTAIGSMNYLVRTCFEEGYPIWYFRGYKFAGVDSQSGKPYYYNKYGTYYVMDSATGQPALDKDGNKILYTAPTDEDRQNIGSAIPDATYGITVNLAYKGFDFMVFGTGTIGNEIFCALHSTDRNKANSLRVYWDKSWREKGDVAKYPDNKLIASDHQYWSSSSSIFNGSYFKFKQIQLGYTLPKKLTQKILISNFRVFASLDDFFTISSYPGCDPETATTDSHMGMGYDVGTYPTSKKVVFGVNVTF